MTLPQSDPHPSPVGLHFPVGLLISWRDVEGAGARGRLAQLRTSGIQAAATTNGGSNRRGQPPFELNRIGI